MISEENMEVLRKIKENFENHVLDIKFDLNHEDDIHEFMIKTREEIERYIKDHGDEIITDENGKSCYVKDLKITQSYEEGDTCYFQLEGHSKEFDLLYIDIDVK